MRLPHIVRHSTRAAALLVLVLPAAAAASPGESSFDIDFRGGTTAEYVRAIRTAAGPVNIVVMPRVESVRVEPMKLTNVSVHAALDLLEGEYETEDALIKISLDVSGSELFSEPIYKLAAELDRHTRSRGVASRVWSIAEILDNGNDASDVVTAIEAALELSGDTYQTAKLRFHRETRLLLARGDLSQVQVIEGLLSELADQRSAEDCESRLINQRAKHDRQFNVLRAQADEWKVEAEALRREATSARTRAELLMRQIERLEEEQSQMRDEMRHIAMERDALGIRVATLQKELAEKR